MSEIRNGTSNGLQDANTTRTVHIRSIEVNLKGDTRRHPVAVLFRLDRGKEERSSWYGVDAKILWHLDKQFASSSQVMVALREQNTFWDKTIAVVIVDAEELFMKPVLVKDETDRRLSVKIKCETGGTLKFNDLIHCLVDESQKRLADMRFFLERLGKVCEALNYLVRITELVSDIHPAAQATVLAVSVLYEVCKKQRECHEAASYLMADIATYLTFTDIPVNQLKSSMTNQTVRDILVLFEKIARTIIDYTHDSVLESSIDALLLGLLDPISEAFYKGEKICFDRLRTDTLQAIEAWSTFESSPKLFWLHGPSGFGKTTIAHTVAKLFHDQNQLAGCFFADANDINCQDPEKITPTIAYQLAKWHADYRSRIVSVLQDRGKPGIRSGLGAQFELLMKQPMAELSSRKPPFHKPLIIIFDALEECLESKNTRLSFASFVIDMAAVVPWLKVFVSSRKTEKLNKLFQDEHIQALDISDPCLDLPNDIASYCTLCSADYVTSAKTNDQFERDVQGLFSRISMSLKMLNAMNDETAVVGHIAEGRSAIERLFPPVIRAAVEKASYDDDTKSLVKDLLSEICCITFHRPLFERGLLCFLAPLHPQITMEQLHDTLLSLYPLVIKGTTGHMNLVFPTLPFLDFLGDEERAGPFWTDPPVIHNKLAQRCLEVMLSQLKFNICKLESSHLTNNEVRDLELRIRENISDELQHSSLHWMEYVSRSSNVEALRDRVLDILCSPRALYWIEVLSLLNSLKVAKKALLSCADFFKNDDKIARAATELYALLSKVRDTDERSTPHLYVSGLSWVPSNSFVRRKCCRCFGWKLLSPDQEREPDVETSPASASSGAPSFRTKTASSIQFSSKIVFSWDGRRVGFETPEGALGIWNVENGALIGDPLTCQESGICSIEFSPTGNKLAVGSFDGYLRIWDTLNGSLHSGSVESHAGAVWTVAYSPDGNRVATSSLDKTVCIWDTGTGERLSRPIMAHENAIRCLSYSPDGSKIVSGSDNKTLRIWDARSGVPAGKPLKGHSASVYSVSYSPDGNTIVSGSWDETARVWDVRTGGPIGEPIRCHQGPIYDVAHSPDGTKFFSGSKSMTLKIWDATTGAPIGVVPRYESRWDVDKRYFVTIPGWWSGRVAPKMHSLVHSNSPFQIAADGRLRTLNGGLFLWVPLEYRSVICAPMPQSPDNEAEPALKIDWKSFPNGKEWTKIMASGQH